MTTSTTISSTGGRIINTATGLIHYGNTDRFTDDNTNTDSVKIGRPEKDTGLTYDFSAFTQPVVATFTTGRVISFK